MNMTSEADLYVFSKLLQRVSLYDKWISSGVVFSSYYDMFHPLFVVEPYLRLTHNWIWLGRYYSSSGICKALVQRHRESEVAKIA